MNSLLHMELKEEEMKWNFFDDEEAESLYEISLLLEEQIMAEAIREINSL